MPKMANLAIIGAAGASVAALVTQPAFRGFLTRLSGYNAPGGIWRILAILLALANLKNLPFVWHLRFFRAFLYQLYLQPTPIPPQALFQPIVSSTRAPILEMDYNLHKSNSTYFSDMDISRTQLFTALIRNGIKKNSRLYGKGKKEEVLDTMGASGTDSAPKARGRHLVALGGVSCLFKKEILPYQKYEMWTRLLTWDRKWFYIVTHLVKPGVGKPTGYSLQPWRKAKAVATDEGNEAMREKLKGAVYATALAKYVVKRGRITVPPEVALFDSDMVPAKPEGWEYKGSVTTDINGALNGDAGQVFPKDTTESEEWNWDVIEAERLRGLHFAEAFAAMEGLHEIWEGGEKGVMGEYADLLF